MDVSGPKTLGLGVHEPAIAPERPADMTMIWLEVARCTRQLSQGNSAGYFQSFQKLPSRPLRKEEIIRGFKFSVNCKKERKR